MQQLPGCGTFTVESNSPSVRVDLPALARERAYNIENPQYPLDDPSVWTEGTLSTAGERVTPSKMLALPALYQAVVRISGDVARCPLEPYEEDGPAWKILRDDPLYRLTAIQPNREMDAFKFWQRVMVQRLIYCNAYVYIVIDSNGRPAELLPLLSDRTEPKRKTGVLYFETTTNGFKVQLPADRVLHLEDICLDNLCGHDPMKAMREAIGLAIAQMKFTARVFRTGGRRGGVLEIPLAMTKTSADRLEEGFRRKYEDPAAWFSTVVLRDNAKFHEAQMTLRDSQLIEGRKESVRDVARYFNIRPGMLGDDAAAGVYKNRQEDMRDYTEMTLRPHMTGIAMQCRTKLLEVDRQAKQGFCHNTDELLQMTAKEEIEAYGLGVEKMVLTSNEARGKLGMPPIAGGDELRNPNTSTQRPGAAPAKKKPDPPADDETTDPAGDEDEADAYNALSSRHEKLVAQNVADVVRVIGEQAVRATASGAKFCAWLDEKLPEKRANLERAGLDPAAAQRQLEIIIGGLDVVTEHASEAGLRAGVENFFQTWSYQP